MSTEKFSRGSRVLAKRWLDCGAPKGVDEGTPGIVMAGVPVRGPDPEMNYYAVNFGPSYNGVVVAEGDIVHESGLDEFIAEVDRR